MNNCVNGNCSKCGQCCTPFLPMSKNELKVINNYLKKHPNILKEAYDNSPIKDNHIYIRCCFYKDNKCLIYDVRPLICKLYKCNQDEQTVEKNKKFISKKAFYNTEDVATLTDFRDIFFGDKTILIAGIKHFMNFKDVQEIKDFCIKYHREDILKALE